MASKRLSGKKDGKSAGGLYLKPYCRGQAA